MQYHRAVHFHRLGEDPASDRLVFRPEEKEHWPGVNLSPDGRWLVVTVARTFDQMDVYLQEQVAGAVLAPVVRDLPFSYHAQVAAGRLYIRTNEGAPEYRLYLADPTAPTREHWREIVPPRHGAVLDGFLITKSALGLSYLERASSRLRVTDLEGGNIRQIELPTIGSLFGWGGAPDSDELFYGFSSYTCATTRVSHRARHRPSGTVATG